MHLVKPGRIQQSIHFMTQGFGEKKKLLQVELPKLENKGGIVISEGLANSPITLVSLKLRWILVQHINQIL